MRIDGQLSDTVPYEIEVPEGIKGGEGDGRENRKNAS